MALHWHGVRSWAAARRSVLRRVCVPFQGTARSRLACADRVAAAVLSCVANAHVCGRARDCGPDRDHSGGDLDGRVVRAIARAVLRMAGRQQLWSSLWPERGPAIDAAAHSRPRSDTRFAPARRGRRSFTGSGARDCRSKDTRIAESRTVTIGRATSVRTKHRHRSTDWSTGDRPRRSRTPPPASGCMQSRSGNGTR